MDDQNRQPAPLPGEHSEPMIDEDTAVTADSAEATSGAEAPEAATAAEAEDEAEIPQQAPEPPTAEAEAETETLPEAPEAPAPAEAEAEQQPEIEPHAPEAPVSGEAGAEQLAEGTVQTSEEPVTDEADPEAQTEMALQAPEAPVSALAEPEPRADFAPQAPEAPATAESVAPQASAGVPARSPAEAPGNGENDMASLLAASDEQFRQLKYGDVIEGTIMRKDADEILVDIGFKSEGIIPSNELSSLTAAEVANLSIGDEVLVSVLQPEDKEGHVVLSLDRARQEKSWRNLQKQHENSEVIEAEISGYNKGGLLVNLEGVRGFVPASQISGLGGGGNEQSKVAELARFTGQKMPLKIIEINRNRNRLILSERQAMQGQRDARKEELLQELEPGQIREGRVSSICDFGAFVDIGGADGLIHLSELSWVRVMHPREVVTVGQPVRVFVMSVDPRDRKIALSLKRTQPEPWATVMEHYHLGQLVRGTITQLTEFGAFARLADGIEGLIHVSELAEGRVTHPRNVVQEGWELTLRVIRIDQLRRRMALSLKRAMEAQEGDTMPPQEPLPPAVPRSTEAGQGGRSAGARGRGRGEQAQPSTGEETLAQPDTAPAGEPAEQPQPKAQAAVEETQTAMAQAMNAARDTQAAEAETAGRAEAEAPAAEIEKPETEFEPVEAQPPETEAEAVEVEAPEAGPSEAETPVAEAEAEPLEAEASEAEPVEEETPETETEAEAAEEESPVAGSEEAEVETPESGAETSGPDEAEAVELEEVETPAAVAETEAGGDYDLVTADTLATEDETGEASEGELAEKADDETAAEPGETAEAGADVDSTEAESIEEAEPTAAEVDVTVGAERGSDAKHGKTNKKG